MAEVSRREEEAQVVPDPDIDTYMKVLLLSLIFSLPRFWSSFYLQGFLCFSLSRSDIDFVTSHKMLEKTELKFHFNDEKLGSLGGNKRFIEICMLNRLQRNCALVIIEHSK